MYTFSQFETALKRHDWTADMSDDPDVSRRGRAEEHEIRDMARELVKKDPKKVEKLYNKYGKDGWGKEWEHVPASNWIVSSILKMAKSIMSSGPAKAELFAAELGKVPGVTSSVVNDFFKVSSNPDVFKVDVFVYADPVMGGRLTNRLKVALRRAEGASGVKVDEFWPPRADRDVVDSWGIHDLANFYRQNPYKVLIICREEPNA